MKSITLRWLRSSKRNPIFFLIAFALLLAFLLFYSKARLQLEEDMLSSLPESIKLELLKKISERQKTDRLVGIQFLGSQEEINEQITYMDSCLMSSGFLDSSMNREMDFTAALEPIISSTPAYLKPHDYVELRDSLSPNGQMSVLKNLKAKLYSPESMISADLIFKDPFGGLERSINNIFNDLGSSNLMSSFRDRSDEGIKLYYLNFHSNDIDQGRAFEDYIQARINELQVDAKPQHFGYYLIALTNADQIKKDTYVTMGIAGVLILIILLLYYRKFSIVILFGLPIVFAFAFSLGIFAIWGRSLSAISIGMGAVVIGIILDFSFHFFTHYRISNSLKETLRAISNPLTLGALTTIFAFGALFFTNSKAMQDFGLFASFSILGAALFTLFILPVFILVFRIDYSNIRNTTRIKLPRLNSKVRMFITVSVIGTTVVMAIFAYRINFTSDLNSLNFYPDELKNKEAEVIGMDTRTSTSVFAFATGKTVEEARELNLKVQSYLDSIHLLDSGFNYLSTAIINPSQRKIEDCFGQWNAFWRSNEGELAVFDSLSLSVGFTADAFDEFRQMTRAIPNYLMVDSLAKLFPIDFSFEADDGFSMASLIEYPLEKYDEYLTALGAFPGVELISRRDLATDLVNTLEADFNYILFISIFIVVLALLMVYGRIELMLITFLPMAISWVWILGFAYLFGIEFNFVNIIVCTFVFGLGDDFAIFITDGHLQELREGRKELPVFKNAIFLSAITTIIGVGALWFAQHPALNSIAPMAVLGMIIILISSFLIQPWLFENLITKRTNKNKPPLTLVGLFCSIFAFSYFFFGCTVLFVLLGIFLLMPIRKKPKVAAYNWVISKFAGSLIYIMINVRKRIIGKEHLNKKEPAVIIANHASFIDILALIMLHPKIKLLTNDWVYNSIVFGWAVRYAGYVTATDGTETNLKAIREMTEEGYSIAVFPEGTRSKDGQIGRFHKGAFLVADELKLPIVPIILHGFHYTMSKHDYLLKNGRLTIKILPAIQPDDISYGIGYKARTKAISTFFKDEFRKLSEELETAQYYYQRIKSNYDYRGPLVESYFKVKWRFERDHFDYYSRFINNDDRLIDAGCGYGYYSFFLHYKYPGLQIDAVDMDEQKIAYASNGTEKTGNLTFWAGDIKAVDYSGYTKIFFNDVLHYLSETDLNTFTNELFSQLKPSQTVFIRDGNEDDGDSHKTTKLTEVFSTSTGFNKTTNQLFFFGKTWLEGKATEHNLKFEMIDQESRTSNVLYIIKCPQ